VLVRLTEVCQSSYTVPTAEDYTLREVFINPEHVVMIREESRMKNLNEQGALHKDLDKNHRFTRLTINRGHTGTEIVVVGAPSVIEGTLNDKRKKLIKG
jgi:hypothetical protein